jgi:uncharacterized protein
MRRWLCALLFLASPLLAHDPVRLQIESKVLGETRTILVHTPDSYATGTQAYPVLYMTDGDRQIAHTVATAEFLAREGRMPDVITVGISNTDRTRDLTPTRVESVEQNGQTVRFPTSGGGEKFLTFIATELIPHVEKTYRTRPYRVFAGHSFGGLFALQSLFSRPRLFNAVLAVSPALIWDDRWVIKRATELVNNQRELNTTLVFTVGDEGEALDREFRDLEALLKQKAPQGFEVEAIKFADEDHGSVVMPSHYAGLRRIFAPWRFRVDGDPQTLFARATDHYAKLSKRTGYTIAIPEPTTNLIGYRLLQSGQIARAAEVFRANVEAYPNSANVYDSLGEAYERLGDLDKARLNYSRAVEIGKKTADPNTAVFEQNLKRVSGQVKSSAGIAARVAELGGTVVRDGDTIVRIDLHGTAVTDADLVVLSAVPNLRELDLRLTKVTDAAIPHVVALKKLEFLNLFRSGVSDAGVRQLATLNELRTLLIGGTKVTDEGIAAIATLPHLRKISVFQTAVSDEALVHLKRLPSLKVLLIGRSGVNEHRARAALPSVRFSEQT